MFEQLTMPPSDPILHILQLYREDPREHKIDLSVGVFRDAQGNTPVMKAVREAEYRLHQRQSSKSYIGLAGDEQFNAVMIDMVLADSPFSTRVRTVQTPGGSGALTILSKMLAVASTNKTVWISTPTWSNHYPIVEAAGLKTGTYPYFDRANKMVDQNAFIDHLKTLGRDDIVLLHGCCHNPTGAELSTDLWDEVARICAKNGIFPYIDMAYQGFAESLHQDSYGVRTLMAHVESMVVAISCSKNFGLYRDRVGCAMLLAENEQTADVARGHLMNAGRISYSMPPDHGAAIVADILTDNLLREQWQNELHGMCQRILNLRTQLADTLSRRTGSAEWGFIAHNRGMFSTLCLSDQQVETLRTEHAIYVVDGGRINVAGFANGEQIDRFADALVAITQH